MRDEFLFNCEKEIMEANLSLMCGQKEDGLKKIKKVSDNIMQEIGNSIHPFTTNTLPYVIAALRVLANKLEEKTNGEWESTIKDVSTAVSVLKDNLERYDKQMKMHGIMGGDLLDENPTISAMRKAVEILENIKIVYQKTVIPNELYRDGNIEHVKKDSAIGMADELINYIEFKDRYIFELDQKEIVGKLMIIDMRKGAKK